MIWPNCLLIPEQTSVPYCTMPVLDPPSNATAHLHPISYIRLLRTRMVKLVLEQTRTAPPPGVMPSRILCLGVVDSPAFQL